MPDDEAPMVLPARRPSMWWLITVPVAWTIIVAVIVVNLFFTRPSPMTKEAGEKPAPDVIFDLQARYFVGAGQIQGGSQKPALVQQLPTLEAGVASRRAKVTILTGEMAGPKAALDRLRGISIESPLQPIEKILVRMYEDFEAHRWHTPSLAGDERGRLITELGWYGELALMPPGVPFADQREKILEPARQTFVVVLCVVIGGLALAGIGALGLIVLALCWRLGYARSSIATGQGRVAVWAETFALYMLIFVGLAFGFSFLKPPFHKVALSGIAALASLSALVWPRIRGVPWSDTRRAIGLTWGRGLFTETAAGVGAYILTLPIMGIGLMVTFLLMALTKKLPGFAIVAAGDPPSHPIVPMLVGAHWSVKLTILVLASVIAPLVEEIMFRGVFYRHLRESTGKLGGLLSFFISTAIVSFVFAAIHPQGWMGIPALMAIACGFTIVREWRGSLIPCMIAHGINNGLVMTLVLVATG